MRPTRLPPLILALAGALGACAGHSTHQAEVARRGSHVMPFSLPATTHVFAQAADGGLQQVLVKDPADAVQIARVRQHLQEIAAQFSRGDFSAPSHIHGDAMPGLAALKAAPPGAIAIGYRELPDGAELRYRTQDPALVAALHDWFDAQVADHGADAVAGHAHPAGATGRTASP
jgi:hypothetical protein